MTFTGKVDDLFMFLADLKECATMCCWLQMPHSVLMVTKNNKDYNLLEDYGVLTEEDIETAYEAHQAGTDVRAKQNALMMHNCIYASISEEAKSRYVSLKGQYQDRPMTCFIILQGTFVTMFTHLQ